MIRQGENGGFWRFSTSYLDIIRQNLGLTRYLSRSNEISYVQRHTKWFGWQNYARSLILLNLRYSTCTCKFIKMSCPYEEGFYRTATLIITVYFCTKSLHRKLEFGKTRILKFSNEIINIIRQNPNKTHVLSLMLIMTVKTKHRN